MLSDEELQNLAKEELLKDVKSAAVRAELYGAHRWAKPKIPFANKRFLKHMLLSGKSVEKFSQRHETHKEPDKGHHDDKCAKSPKKSDPKCHKKNGDTNVSEKEHAERKLHDKHHNDYYKTVYKKKK